MRHNDKLSLLESEEIFFEFCLDTPHRVIAQRLGRAFIDVETQQKRYACEPITLLRRNFYEEKVVKCKKQ